jgi:O-antigen ligase
MAPTSILPARLVQFGIPAFAALVGLVAGLSPKFGIAAALGVIYVAIVVSDLALGVALFLAITFLESIQAFSGLSLAKAAGGLLLVAWMAVVATDRDDARQLLRERPGLVAGLAALGTWTLLSVLWSELPGTALDASLRWILNLSLFPIVYTAVRERRHVRWMFVLFIVGALISAAAGLATGTSASADPARLEGTGINANELGELLIVAVVLAGALGASRDLSAPARVLAFVASALCTAALLQTASRGALVGLVVALLLTPVLAGPRRRGIALALILAAVTTGGVYLLAVAPAENLERLTAADATGSGRTDIWKVGLRMVSANPVVGVGAGNYPNSTIHYLFEPGTITRSDFIVDLPKPAHNVYLQALAELGAVGLTLFLLVLGASLRAVLLAARTFRRAGDRSMELLSRALLIGLCGLLASAFFSTAIYSKQLWLMLALAVAVHALARERAAPPAA